MIYCPHSNKHLLSNKYPLYFVFVNKCPYSIGTLIPISAPYTNECPSSVSVISPQRICTHGDQPWVIFPLIAHVEPHLKNSGLYLSISTIMFTWVHSSFKQNDLVLKFCDDRLAGVIAKKDSWTTLPFSICNDSFQVTIKAFFYTFCYF